jgi:hypothetical protein
MSPGHLWSHIVVLALLGVSKRCGMAGGVCSRASVRSSERVDAGDVQEHKAASLAQAAVKVPAFLWAIRRRGCKPGEPSLAAGGEAEAADELS